MKARTPYLLLSGAVVLLDQATKLLVSRLMDLHESRPIVDGLVNLTYIRNRGAAFGILSDADIPYQALIFALVSLGVLVAIAVYSLRLAPESRLPQAALALVMGGAVGNLLDRALLGYVIDFVDVFWGPHHWPAFNVADSSISVGVALLVVDMLRTPQGAERKPEIAEAASPAGRTR